MGPAHAAGLLLAVAVASAAASQQTEKPHALARNPTQADDSVVDRVLLESAVEWPEQVGGGEARIVRGLIERLDRVVTQHPVGGRAVEARYRRGLLRLEPVSGCDPAGAEDDLRAVANSGEAIWAPRARYALAWLQEQAGDLSRAQDAYERVVVDHPSDVAAARSMAGLGRLSLLDGEPGRAAALLDLAIAEGAGPDTGAALAREAAVRRLLEPTLPLGAPRSVALPMQDVSAIVAEPEGLLVADRRGREVVRLAAEGAIEERWSWDVPIDALASDSRGRSMVAAGGALWRLGRAGQTVEVAKLGEFDPPGAVALGAGGVWVIDRRGQRLGRLEPGQTTPAVVAEDREAHLVALAWDGHRLLGLDGRSGEVRALWAVGATLGPVAAAIQGFHPESLAVDSAGRLLLADRRSEMLRILDSSGRLLAELDEQALGVERITAAVFGPDGRLHLVDGRGARWVSWP